MAAATPSGVPANDFSRQWADIGEDVLAAVDRVGRSGRLILGEEVERFEEELAAWWGVEHAVGVASGLDAIEIALRCAGVGPGALVLTTPLTAFATTLAVIRAGCEPVWCDVDESGGMDLERADAALRAHPEIRAILPVHLYGHPLDPDGFRDLSAEHEAVLIGDCAQSAGATRSGWPTGATEKVAATSFYPTKNLGAMGDGGAVLAGDVELAERARRMRDYGQVETAVHAEPGLNSRLDELQAALMRSALLPRLDRFIARRREIAAHYEAALRGGSLRPLSPSGGESARHLFPVEVVHGEPEAIAAELRELGIAVGRHYPRLCPDQPAARGIGISADPLAVARRIAERELSLPIHPYLTEEEVERVVEACLAVAG